MDSCSYRSSKLSGKGIFVKNVPVFLSDIRKAWQKDLEHGNTDKFRGGHGRREI
jgi:hypothetical protein